jgi:rSAM/selenodomain-associated transferase 2
MDDALSVIIPTLNAAPGLAAVLPALAGPPVAEVIVVDGGSRDDSRALAAAAGARVIEAARGRGAQLAAGAAVAQADWLLFLHADTRPGAGWRAAVGAHLARPENAERAGYFRFCLDDARPAARRLERLVAWRCRVLGLPYGDQGLLISRAFYHRLGGFRPLALMEDVDLVRRIGRRRLVALPAPALTSAVRYERGLWRRSARNLGCLSLYFLGAPPGLIARLYH